MRGWTITVIIFVCAVIVVGLFHFLFKNQMDKKVATLEAENAGLQQDLKEIAEMKAAIEPMAREIPLWKQKIAVYRAAVPHQIEDNEFFRTLRKEMNAAGVGLLNVEVNPGGAWIGELKEEEAQKLADIGIDVEAARSLKVAFYSIELLGPYDNTLDVLENLKKHGRMYSIDEVVGPAGSGGGTITQVLDATATPIQVKGKIFYGIPADYVSEQDLNAVFSKVVLQPLAGKIGSHVADVGEGFGKQPNGAKE
jgi:hypothetical protein